MHSLLKIKKELLSNLRDQGREIPSEFIPGIFIIDIFPCSSDPFVLNFPGAL